MIKVERKSIIVTAVSVAVIIAAAIFLRVFVTVFEKESIACSETFIGYVSESRYSTREATARGFVEEQLGGEAGTPVYADCKVLGEMTQGELDALPLSSQQSRSATPNVIGGENCEISYTVANRQRKVKAGILYTDDGDYLYYVRLPEVGEQPTKAYMDAVFDGKNYTNCTARSCIGVTVGGIATTYMQTIKFADDKAFFKQELPGTISELYLREKEGTLTAYLKRPDGSGDNKFYTVGEINAILAKDGLMLEDIYFTRGAESVKLTSLQGIADVTELAFTMPIDSSYFLKTDYGLAMTDDNFKVVCKSLLGAEYSEEIDETWNELNVHFHSDYYVSEGRLVRQTLKLQMFYENTLIVLNLNSDFFAFGKTEVVIPHA